MSTASPLLPHFRVRGVCGCVVGEVVGGCPPRWSFGAAEDPVARKDGEGNILL